MMHTVELTNAALVFTDAATGQGYLREMKAVPVHPFEIRKMKPGGE